MPTADQIVDDELEHSIRLIFVFQTRILGKLQSCTSAQAGHEP